LKVTYAFRRAKDLNELIVLEWNYPVDINQVRKFTTIFPAVPFTINYRVEKTLQGVLNTNKQIIIITPSGEKPNTSYRLVISRSLVPIGGELGMEKDYTFSYKTYEPLSVRSFSSSDGKKNFVGALFVYRESLLTIEFNNDLEEGDVSRWVTVTPPVANLSVRASGSSVYISGDFSPDIKNYTLTVSPGIRDVYGQTLQTEKKFSFQVEDSPSFVSAPTGYLIMERYLANLFPVKSINISGLEFSYISLTNPSEIAEFLAGSTKIDSRMKTKTISLPWRKNNFQVFHIPLKSYHPYDSVNNLFENGFFIYSFKVQRETPARKNWGQRENFRGYIQFVDFSVTLKTSPGGDLLIARWLKNNAPVTNATVYAYSKGKFVPVSKTGKTGTALVEDTSDVYMVEAGSSRFYIGKRAAFDWYGEYYGEDTDSSVPSTATKISRGNTFSALRPESVLFTDRYLYQRGETVNLKGIFRYRYKDDWLLSPPQGTNRLFSLVIKDAREETILSTNIKPTANGSFDLTFTLPEKGPTGYYEVELIIPEGEKNSEGKFSTVFQVEEFRPARAEMRIQVDKSIYFVGETVKLDLVGWYLFGAPVGKPVDYSVVFQPGEYKSKRFPGYRFSSQEWWHSQELASGTVIPDKNGVASTKLSLASLSEDGFLSIYARTVLPDDIPVGGSKLGIEVRKKLHLGVKVGSYFLSLSQPVEVECAAVDENDAITTNRALLVVNRYEWKSFRVVGNGGRFQWEWRRIVTPVYSNVITVSSNTLRFFLQEPGYYTATLFEIRGNQVIPHGTTDFYAVGGGSYGWLLDNDDRVEVIVDKENYSVGEKATILIKNPYKSARALITIEREKFYKSFDIPATNSMVTFTIPIETNFIPNMYVSVLLYTGRTGVNMVSNDVDYARPQYRLGYAELKVVPREKRISVGVTTDKPSYSPRDKVKASITLQDMDGKPLSGEVTISVADVGVLNLVNYRLPNPISVFYAPRPLAVSTLETRNFIYGQRYLNEKGEIVGGDGGISLGMIVPRSQIRYTAFYEAKHWVTNGTAEVTFSLPDNLTSFRVMAVAHTRDSLFGYGESTFTVSRSLMVLESFPSFVRIGDSFMGGGILFNYSGKRQQLVAELSVSDGLSVGGNRVVRTNIVLENNASQEVLFPVQVSALREGEVSMTMKVLGDGVSDGITKTFPVTIMRYPEVVATYGMVTQGQNQAIQRFLVTTNVASDLSSIEMVVAPTAFVELKGNLDYLVNYPYGCVEQKTSKILPLIVGEDVILSYRLLQNKTKEDLRSVVAAVIKELPDYYKDKGFSYWKDSSYVSGYLTVYVFWVMTLAKQAGYTIEENFYNRVMAQVKSYIQNRKIPDERNTYYRWLTLSYALYAASMNGYADVQRWKETYAEMKKPENRSLSAMAFLLMALKNYPDFAGKEAFRSEILQYFEQNKQVSSAKVSFTDKTDWGWFYYTDVISTAIVLQSILESQGGHADAYKVIRFLLDSRRGDAWLHTHENVWVWYVLSTYLKRYEKEEPASSWAILSAGKKLLEGEFSSRLQPTVQGQYSLSADDVGEKELQLSRQGRGSLYYTYRYRYVPRRNLQPLVGNGFVIKKRYLDPVTGTEVSVLKRGQDYLVEIVVQTSQNRSMVVVDDALPAGVEVVNLSFATESNTPNSAKTQSNEDGYYWYGFDHKEIYRDRVIFTADFLSPGTYTLTYLVRAASPGRFGIPGVHVEEMYAPENFATSYLPESIVVQ